MSDLISRSAVIDIIHKEIQRTTSWVEHDTQINIKFAIEELPTVEAIPKERLDEIVERLEEKRTCSDYGTCNHCQMRWCPLELLYADEVIEIMKGVIDERD